MTAMGSEVTASILAVLVVYCLPPDRSATLRSLSVALAQADETLDLLVYDNSPQPMIGSSKLAGHFRVTYRHDPTNAGVSAAFNAGAGLAREQGKQWLLLLDQDTSFPPETVAVYLDAIRSGGAAMFVPQLAAGTKLLSPCGYLAGIGFHLPGVTPGEMALCGRSVLNSGLLMKLADFEACGGYDEKVLVDFADFTFINRFRQRHSGVMVLDLICQHGFSNLERVDIEAALRRYAGYCRDGREAAATLLLLITHAFLVLRRCLVLTFRYGSLRFLTKLPIFFSAGQRGCYR